MPRSRTSPRRADRGNARPAFGRQREPSPLRTGKRFDATEKAGWPRRPNEDLFFEKRIIDEAGRAGRIDVFVQSDPGMIGLAEIKATDWDRIRMERVRVLALRHARQAWRYIGSQRRAGLDVCPGVIYPKPPRSRQKLLLVEEVLNERLIQCVWRNPRGSGASAAVMPRRGPAS